MSFKSVLTTVWDDLKKVFENPTFDAVAGAVIGIADPALSPVFKLTVNAVQTTEANFAAKNNAAGTGVEKAAAVVTGWGNLIEAGLQAAGVKNLTVQQYIDAVVAVLKTVPSPATGTTSVPASS